MAPVRGLVPGVQQGKIEIRLVEPGVDTQGQCAERQLLSAYPVRVAERILLALTCAGAHLLQFSGRDHERIVSLKISRSTPETKSILFRIPARSPT